MNPDHEPETKPITQFDIGVWLRDWIRSEPLLLVGALLTLLICYGILNRWPYINGPEEWLWTYIRSAEPIETLVISILKLLPFALGFVLVACILALILPKKLKTPILLLLMLAWGMYYQWRSLDLMHLLPPEALITTMLNPPATGYNTVAGWIGTDRLPPLLEFLATYPQHMTKEWPIHVQTHPPGNVLLGYAVQEWIAGSPTTLAGTLKRFFQNLGTNFEMFHSNTLLETLVAMLTGLLMQIGAVLTALPLFLVVRGNEPRESSCAIAWMAALIWLHMPGAILFTPSYDQFYPLFAMTALWAGWRASVSNPLAWGAVSGFFAALGIFMTFKMILWIPTASLMLFAAMASHAGSWRPSLIMRSLLDATEFRKKLIRGLGAALAAFFGFYILIWLAWGINVLAIFLQAGVNQARLTVDIGRTYFIWLLFGPWDILLFTGPGLVAMVLAMTGRSLINAARNPRLVNPVRDVTIPALILVTLSGLVLGENARQLIMFYPMLAWLGAAWLCRPGTRRDFRWASLCAVIFLQHCFMAIALNLMRFIDH